MKRVMFLCIFLVLASTAAADVIIANSANWKNVYSAGMYAGLNNDEFRFLVSQKHSQLIQRELEKDTSITVIESDTLPFVGKFAERLRQNGYVNVNNILVPEETANFDLAKRLNVRDFIIVDPTFGHDAVSVAPLGIHTDHYVLFADSDNIGDVSTFLSTVNPNNIIIYGDVDEAVLDALEQYQPELIYEGNRFKNNIAIAERLRTQTGAKQAILTNGEFLEADLFSRAVKQPVVFIGRENPPEEIADYLSGHYQTFVVVGNDLLQSAQRLKDRTGKPVLLKFAKGVTDGETVFKNVEGLDLYPVPLLSIELSLEDLAYNTQTQNIEVTITNEQLARTYLINNLIIRVDDETVASLGDYNAQIIEGLETQTFTFDAALSEYQGQNITVELFTPYGASSDALERAISETRDLSYISAEDKCPVTIESAEYNKATQRFEVTINAEDCYARAMITDLTLDDEPETIQSSSERVSGDKTITIKQRMSEVDIADNPLITVTVRHGKREDVLSQTTSKDFELVVIDNPDYTPLFIGIIAILLIILIILWKRKR